MKIYIANHKNESFQECKDRTEATKKLAEQKRLNKKETKWTPIPANPFNGLS